MRARRAQTAAMAPLARPFSGGLESCPGTLSWGAVVFVWLFLSILCTGTERGVPGAAGRWEGTIEGRCLEFQRLGGRRTGGGGAQRLRPPDPQGLRRSLCARGRRILY